MDAAWRSEFEHRMRSFAAAHPGDGIGLSLKVRVTSGCFHREHSPEAYTLIDATLHRYRVRTRALTSWSTKAVQKYSCISRLEQRVWHWRRA